MPIANISTLKFLKRLNLSYNQISEIWNFPESLEILLLNSNLISNCLNDSLKSLKNLTTLDLSHNMICDVSPLSQITTLKYLFLKNNHLNQCSSLFSLVNLCELDIESNEISAISELKCWEKHNNITIINAKGNPVIKLNVLF